MSDNLTILVKKADGSFIHVPLSELGKKKEPAATPPARPLPALSSAEARVQRPSLPPQRRESERGSSLVEPERGLIKHDLSSPLEEPAPAIHPAMPLRSSGREDQVESIIKSLSFKVLAGNVSRFRTVIQLFLKDIRGERETIEILTRREIEGGVGLSEGQAEEAVQKSKQTNVSKFDPKESARLEKEVPAVRTVTKPLPALSSAEARVQRPSLPPQRRESERGSSLVEPERGPAVEPVFKISADRVKTTMSDVKAPVEYAPVDEIRYFSLTDFRRIAGNPTDAAARLKQKFLNLNDESIVLFFEALEAWRGSPLYLDYLAFVGESLSKRTPLARSGDKLKIQLPEIIALVEMEKDF